MDTEKRAKKCVGKLARRRRSGLLVVDILCFLLVAVLLAFAFALTAKSFCASASGTEAKTELSSRLCSASHVADEYLSKAQAFIER